ncbi:MAG TPA: hypothetical protein VFF65_00985, partial [Phycisphaerales bacterium]|nr:hypothetical protein [Phycisphaerales bacterium]
GGVQQPGGRGYAGSSYYGAGYYGGGYGGYDGGWWDDGASNQLPALYIKLGDFQRAERMFLLSSGGDGVESRLPSLAYLMWDQDARDRSLELMRTSMALTSNDRYSYGGGGTAGLVQYAAMLAEAGKTAEAQDLLVRAYRWSSSDEDQSSYYYGYNTGGNESLERSGEQSVSRTLYNILVRAGTLEKAMADLSAESSKDPSDQQLNKLVISLQKRQRQWAQMRDGLARRAASLPHGSAAVTRERLGAALQAAAWDEALTLIGEAKLLSPAQGAQLSAQESFVRLMKVEPDKAVAALKPVMDAPLGDAQAALAARYWTALLALTGSHEQLREHLLAQRAAGLLDDGGNDLLARTLVENARFADAAAIALEQQWRKQSPFRSGDQWWRTLVHIAARAKAAGTPPSSLSTRPADVALLTMAAEGPAEGLKSFAALCASPEPGIDALRGLIFAARACGDHKQAMEASTRLLAALEPVRNNAWYAIPSPSLEWLARAMVTQGSQGSQYMAAMGASMDRMVGQLTAGAQRGYGYQREPLTTVTYAQLLDAHQGLHRRLAARTMELEPLGALVKSQQKGRGGYTQYGDSYGYGSAYPGRYSPRTLASQFMFGGQGSTPFSFGGATGYTYGSPDDEQQAAYGATDPEALVRSSLLSAGSFETLDKVYTSLGARTPQREWAARGTAAAAAGRSDDAAAWRRRAALAQLAALQTTDTPALASTDSRWRWYAYSYDGPSSDLAMLRWALQTPTVQVYDMYGEQPFYGEPKQLWELAIIDPAVEQSLLKLESQVGPGWESTRTLDELLNYHRARKNAQRVAELMEKTGGPEQMMRARTAAHYVWACFTLRDSQRLEALLTAAGRADATLKNELDCARLAMMRLKGENAAADALEQRLLAATAREPRTPRRIAAGLITPSRWGEDYGAPSGGGGQQYEQDAGSYYQYESQQARLTQPRTLTDLAAAFGVRLEPAQGPGGLGEGWLRSYYVNKGLYTDALRLIDAEIAAAGTTTDRWALMEWKGYIQSRAGQADAALQTVTELAKELDADIANTPTASAANRLARLWASNAGGKNAEKALAALQVARRCDPASDAGSQLTIHCLYTAGKHKQGWDAWQSAALDGGSQAQSELTLHQAAQCALASGDKENGARLARLALYRFPASTLATKTREMSNE